MPPDSRPVDPLLGPVTTSLNCHLPPQPLRLDVARIPSSTRLSRERWSPSTSQVNATSTSSRVQSAFLPNFTPIYLQTIKPATMPPSAKRQKLNKAPDASGQPVQRGIQAFGTISKPVGHRHELGKRKLDRQKGVDRVSESAFSIGVNRPKRKREGLSEHSAVEDLGRACCLSSPVEHQDDQHPTTADGSELPTPLPQLFPKQPSKNREKARTPSLINRDSTHSGRAYLESLPLAPSSPSDLNVISLSSSLKPSETPPPSPLPTKSPSSHPRNTLDDPLRVPDELQDLIDLYSSFLTALSLHYAHNGWPTPADLRLLRPSVERSWRRKRVCTDDVRRILGIEQGISAGSDRDERLARLSDLSLVDYGNGKICIEINADLQPQGFQRRLLDEEALNRRFAKNLMRRWATYRESCKVTPTAGAFTSQLPLASITLCTSLLRITPLLAKGQRRLEDLKAGAIRAQQSSSKPITSCPSSLAPKPATSRNDSLLSRIRAKQLHQSTLTPPPEQSSILLRKSAFRRLQEIIPVLELLTTATATATSTSNSCSSSISSAPQSSPSEPPPSSDPDKAPQLPLLPTGTCSYTMATVVQHLQTSLRSPISKDDAIRCIRLLATEVAPEWVRVCQVGKVVGVVVRRGGWRGGSGETDPGAINWDLRLRVGVTWEE